GYADAAILKLNTGHPAVGLIQQARTAALKAATSAQCLLSFARKTPSRRRAVDLNALVSRMEPLLRILLDGDIELHLSLEAGSVVFCHPDAREGLVLSLAMDAKRSMPRGGALRVSTRLLEVSE